jgi:hypothetical protein
MTRVMAQGGRIVYAVSVSPHPGAVLERLALEAGSGFKENMQ